MGTPYWKGGTDTAWATAGNWLKADGGAYGSVPLTGDDVKMLHDSAGAGYLAAVGVPARYCTAGPTAPITINSLVVTMIADATSSSIISTNGGNLTISGAVPLALVGAEAKAYNLRYTDAAAITGASAGGFVIIGDNSAGTSTPSLLSGCNALFVIQPANIANPNTKTIVLNVPQGASCDIQTLAYFDTTKMGSVVQFGGGQNIALNAPWMTLGGTLTYMASSVVSTGVAYGSAYRHRFSGKLGATTSTAVINFNTISADALGLVIGSNLQAGGGATYNINAGNTVAIMNTIAGLASGTTININAPCAIGLITGAGSSNTGAMFFGSCTMNVRAAVALMSIEVARIITTTITGISKASKAVVSFANGTSVGFEIGQTVTIAGVAGMTEINGTHTVREFASSSVTLETDSSAFTAWSSGGTVTPDTAGTLTINDYGYPITTDGTLLGNVVINGGVANASYDSIVAPADKVLKGTPRWTTATGANIGTLERKVQELKI